MVPDSDRFRSPLTEAPKTMPEHLIAKIDELRNSVDGLSQKLQLQERDHRSLAEKVDRLLEVVDGGGHRVAMDLRLDRLERARLPERIEAIEAVVLELKGVRWGLLKVILILAWALTTGMQVYALVK